MNWMKKIMLLIFIFPIFAVAAPLKLALNWKAEPQFGGFYAAKIQGEFKKRNLDVEIIEGGSGTPTIQMLGANKIDFAIVSAEEVALAQDRGSRVMALFATFQTNPQAIMTHQERQLKSLKEVFASKGVLAIQSGLSYAQFLLKKYPQAKVQVVPYLGGITSFAKDSQYSQQCFITSEPILAQQAGLKVSTFLVSEEGFNPYTTVVAVNETFLKKNPEIAKNFVAAVRAGWQAYLTSPDSTNKHMSEINKAMNLDIFAKSASLQKALIETPETQQKGLGFMSQERWQSLLIQLKELQIIKKPLSPQNLYRNL